MYSTSGHSSSTDTISIGCDVSGTVSRWASCISPKRALIWPARPILSAGVTKFDAPTRKGVWNALAGDWLVLSIKALRPTRDDVALPPFLNGDACLLGELFFGEKRFSGDTALGVASFSRPRTFILTAATLVTLTDADARLGSGHVIEPISVLRACQATVATRCQVCTVATRSMPLCWILVRLPFVVDGPAKMRRERFSRHAMAGCR